jgi:hypothetical protein
VQCGLIIGLALLTGAGSVPAQEASAEIRGTVATWGGQPLELVEVQARASNKQGPTHVAKTAGDGSYSVENLPPDRYDLTVSARYFISVEIKEVRIGPAELKILPSIRVEFDSNAACGTDRSPDYYRLSLGDTATGGLSGFVMSPKKTVVSGAVVTLFVRGKGRISSTSTSDDGRFSFSGLQVGPEEYWITIQKDGFFSEDLTHLSIQPGFESVYSPIILESCSPGRCQPYLKTIRVLPSCA